MNGAPSTGAATVGPLLDDAPCGYLRTTDDGLIVDVNRTLLDAVGRSRDEVVDRLRFVDLLSGGGRIYHETHFVPLLRVEAEVVALALDLRHVDGTRRPVLVSARRTPVGDHGEASVQIVTVDGGTRREYERELLRAKQRAEASETRATMLSRTLQATLIPPLPPHIPGLDVATVYRPAGSGEEVGGDFYEVFQVGDGEWVVTLGDVEGKGVEAAAVASLARHVLRAAAVRVPSPRECLLTLNEVLLADHTTRLLTAAVLRLTKTADGWSVVSSVAGHGLPLLVRADGTDLPLGRVGTILGVVTAPPLFDHRTALSGGDAVVMYTDGVNEARAPGSEEFFGEQRLAGIARDHRRSARALTTALRDEVLAFSGGDTRDDVAVVALVVR